MKHPYWTDPNDCITVLDGTDEAINGYGHRCGSDFIRLGPEHMEALNAGKVLAWNDSDYSTFVVFADAVRKSHSGMEKDLDSVLNRKEKQMIWQEGDWCFCRFKLQQIEKIKEERITSVTDGYARYGNHDFSNCCFPLDMIVKSISEHYEAAWRDVSKMCHPANHNIYQVLVQEWVKTCNQKEDLSFFKIQIQRLESFVEAIKERCRVPNWATEMEYGT